VPASAASLTELSAPASSSASLPESRIGHVLIMAQMCVTQQLGPRLPKGMAQFAQSESTLQKAGQEPTRVLMPGPGLLRLEDHPLPEELPDGPPTLPPASTLAVASFSTGGEP